MEPKIDITERITAILNSERPLEEKVMELAFIVQDEQTKAYNKAKIFFSK